MSKNVSFVCRDELCEWLESKADEEMKSVSSVCQDIVAEAFHRERAVEADKDGESPSDKGGQSPPTDPLETPPFTDHPEAWYVPESADPDKRVAVKVPDRLGLRSDRRYYKTYDGAAAAIERWY